MKKKREIFIKSWWCKCECNVWAVQHNNSISSSKARNKKNRTVTTKLCVHDEWLSYIVLLQSFFSCSHVTISQPIKLSPVSMHSFFFTFACLQWIAQKQRECRRKRNEITNRTNSQFYEYERCRLLVPIPICVHDMHGACLVYTSTVI